jgi:spore maturation protein CgeB
MRLFQIVHLYPPFVDYFENKHSKQIDKFTYKDFTDAIINDGFMGCHLLLPIFGRKNAFFTIWDYSKLQEKWAIENNVDLISKKQILLEQIEKFKPDVIYNMSTQHINFSFFEQLSYRPLIVCWNADSGSIKKTDLQQYDVFFTSAINFIANVKNASLHYPSVDPVMGSFSKEQKSMDVYFYGQLIKGIFTERNEYLIQLSKYFRRVNINFRFALMYCRTFEPMINRRYLWKMKFLQKQFPSKKFEKTISEPDFGVEIYKNIARSKIIFNCSGGLKQFEKYKFNMRIFETLGVGSFMLSDEGHYPEHLIPGEHFDTYKNLKELKDKIIYYLKHETEREEIALNGHLALKKYYSKEKQWQNFVTFINEKA